MNAQEIVMGLINGPGSGFTIIVVGFFAAIVLLVLIRAVVKSEDAYRRAKDERRHDTLEQIQAQLARVAGDQNEIAKQLESPRGRRRAKVIDAEANRGG